MGRIAGAGQLQNAVTSGGGRNENSEKDSLQ